MRVLKSTKLKQAEWKLHYGNLFQNREGFVFTDEFGKHLATRTVYNRFKEIVEKMGLPEVRFHDLRHPDVKQAIKIMSILIVFLGAKRIDTLLQITLSSAFISESILEGGFDFYPVIMKNMNFADSALR